MMDQRPEAAWYAVHCQPLKERLAVTLLRDQLGLAIYLPEIKRRVRGRLHSTPLFPRYLFVRADPQHLAMSQVNATAGVLRLVAFDGVPQPVPATVIAALHERVERCNAEGGLLGHGFQPGDAVRLKHGPLQGLEAVFVGPLRASERVRVLIEFLGHCRQAEVSVDALERVAPAPAVPPAARPPRRTRGRGRPINARGRA
ncbi:MAG TPA: transcription termination/antitermination NusG family protein [Roseiflexaceae bacterium]|nr:transcription termination/antitermination NusG family protein [Roseiflexaceae bacterium]